MVPAVDANCRGPAPTLRQMGRIARTIELAKASWNVLKADKELIALPVLSLIATVAVALTFLVPMFGSEGGTDVENLDPIEIFFLFVAYVTLSFITIFFNAALVHAANERLEGGDPTVGSALRGALSRVHRILPWAIAASTVSIILRALEQRAGTLGRIVIGLLGVAWSLVTFLVIPVLVIEDIGVIEGVKRSGAMFKRTWGENVAAQVGFGLLGFIAVLPALLVAGFAFNLGSTIGFVVLAIAVLWILTASMVLSALNGIFQTALYRHAVGLPVGNDAFAGALEGAFAERRGGRGFGG